ncbi:unnamed protein product [Symbiodinium sp. CCMP2592]|nr:unnamed protein product [Symbiodinium sp. CCMP2592]
MVAAAWQWAAKTKNLRKNPIHGEEEARLVLTDRFEAEDVTSTETALRGTVDVEECHMIPYDRYSFPVRDDSGFLFSNDVPNIDAEEHALANGVATAAAASSATAQQMESFSASASFKQLTFPSLSQTSSPVQLLPEYLEVLGRKIDNTEDVLDRGDRLATVGGARATALRDQIAEVLKGMKLMFSDLTKKQSDALTRPLDKPFSDSILRMFADVTKQDLIMNNYIVRSKSVKSTAGSSKPAKKGKSKDKHDKKEKSKPSKKGGGKKSSMFPRAGNHGSADNDDEGCLSEDDTDDDLAAELLVGFQSGAETAERVVRIAQVAARKLKKLGYTLPVHIDFVETPVRVVHKGKPSKTNMSFPVIKPSSWLSYSLSVGGEAFLGGCCLDAESAYSTMLESFWSNYQSSHPDCPCFTRDDWCPSRTVPICIHGDEGRGKAKHPIMVLSIQPVVGWKGLQHVNSSGLQEYPAGCGKGHDCGLMNAWLEDLIGRIDETTLVP